MNMAMRQRRERGSVLLVIVGVLAVMLIIAAAYMSQIEIETASSMNASDAQMARMVADGLLQGIVTGLELDTRQPGAMELYAHEGGVAANADEPWDHLGDTIVYTGSLFRPSDGGQQFPASNWTLADLTSLDGVSLTGLDVRSRVSTPPGGTERKVLANARIWLVDHAACLSFNHHGNWYAGSSAPVTERHMVLMGADPQEIDLIGGIQQLFAGGAQTLYPDYFKDGLGNDTTLVAMNRIWNYRGLSTSDAYKPIMPAAIFGGKAGGDVDASYQLRNYTDTSPSNGLLDSVLPSGEGEVRVWYPLGRVNDNPRFTLEDELVLQRMRATGRYTSSEASRLTVVLDDMFGPLNQFIEALPTETRPQVYRNVLRPRAYSLTTMQRGQAFGRLMRPDGSVAWIEKFDLNNLPRYDTEEAMAFRQLCLSAVARSVPPTPEEEIKARNLFASIALFNDTYVEKNMPFGDSSNRNWDWLIGANVAVPHRLPVLPAYAYVFVEGDDDGDDPQPDKSALAVQIFNPFDRGIRLNNVVLSIEAGADPITIPLDGHVLQRMENGTRPSLVVLLQPADGGEKALESPDQIYRPAQCSLLELEMPTELAAILKGGTVPAMELRYADDASLGPFSGKLIDRIASSSTADGDEPQFRVRVHPFDASASMENVAETLGTYTQLSNWRTAANYPMLHLGGQSDRFASPAQVGLLLKAPMSDANRWFDPSGSGKLDNGDLVALSDLVGERNGRLLDFFDAVRTVRWAGDPDMELGRISINTAPRDVLLALPGMTAVAADAIIANRPYRGIGELLIKAPASIDAMALPSSDPNSDRFNTLPAGQTKHVHDFYFGLLANTATVRSHLFTVHIQVELNLVDSGSGSAVQRLSRQVLTAIVDRSTGEVQILNKYWGTPWQN